MGNSMGIYQSQLVRTKAPIPANEVKQAKSEFAQLKQQLGWKNEEQYILMHRQIMYCGTSDEIIANYDNFVQRNILGGQDEDISIPLGIYNHYLDYFNGTISETLMQLNHTNPYNDDFPLQKKCRDGVNEWLLIAYMNCRSHKQEEAYSVRFMFQVAVYSRTDKIAQQKLEQIAKEQNEQNAANDDEDDRKQNEAVLYKIQIPLPLSDDELTRFQQKFKQYIAEFGWNKEEIFILMERQVLHAGAHDDIVPKYVDFFEKVIFGDRSSDHSMPAGVYDHYLSVLTNTIENSLAQVADEEINEYKDTFKLQQKIDDGEREWSLIAMLYCNIATQPNKRKFYVRYAFQVAVYSKMDLRMKQLQADADVIKSQIEIYNQVKSNQDKENKGMEGNVEVTKYVDVVDYDEMKKKKVEIDDDQKQNENNQNKQQQPGKSSTKCRFCEVSLDSSNTAPKDHTLKAGLDNVCSGAECLEKRRWSCDLQHVECGHNCIGLRGDECIPCLNEKCLDKQAVDSTEEDYCNICWVDPLRAAPCVKLQCGHYFHLMCLWQKIDRKWPAARITFGFLKCPLCKQEIHHQALYDVTKKYYDLKAEMRKNATECAVFEGLHKDKRLTEPNSPYYKNLPQFALDRLAFYLCFKCNKPYFGGMKASEEAGLEQEEDYKQEHLVCGSCASGSNAKSCRKHGRKYITYKCKFCCSVSCWYVGSTHFCDGCHKKQEHGIISDLPKCPGGDRCPLGIEHPANGTAEFSLGCVVCIRKKKLFDNNDAETKNDSNEYELRDEDWSMNEDYSSWSTDDLIMWINVLDEDFGEKYGDIFGTYKLNGTHFDNLKNEQYLISNITMDAEDARKFAHVVAHRIEQRHKLLAKATEPWSCTACSFMNDPDQKMCKICNINRQMII